MVQAGDRLWSGREDFVQSSNIIKFIAWLERKYGLAFSDYETLWAWSADEPECFWQAIWDYFEIHSTEPVTRILSSRQMPGAVWFEGARVNYAEHVLRHEKQGDPKRPALHHLSELRPLEPMAWEDLGNSVRVLAEEFRKLGIKPGDRIAAYLPNIPETVIAMLATAAIGAIWSAAAPEFGAKTVVDRFSQIEPKLLLVADGYRYGGKDFSRNPEIESIAFALKSVEKVVWLDYLNPYALPPKLSCDVIRWGDLLSQPPVDPESFRYEYVSSEHPLWILFSSGTTGLPKPIVHGHLGILLEHYKSAAFHLNLKPDRAMYFYSTTGWMMWNTLMWAPMMNAAAVLYDGHPAYPTLECLFDIAAKTKVQSLGTSPTVIQNMRNQNVIPKESFDLSALENVFLVGSPATPETFKWLYDNVKSDLWVTSQSGGTEFCSGLVGGSPTLPVYAGEIQARTLGADVHAFDDYGRALVNEPGELVIRKPMPSMPLFLWGDDGFEKYKASYFDTFPGVWRHGDTITINQRGACIVHGRSDATLNRYGVRIGSAEIYRTLEEMPAIADSLVVCIEEPGGGYYMPLFVQLEPGYTLDDKLVGEIKLRLKKERSPRHVPDEILEVPDIPYTITAKKMEVPVRKLLMGVTLNLAASPGAMRNPGALDWYASFASEHRKLKQTA
ncbi:acetoacetate--CoA ligase [Labrenzia sp. DG1229]|uniref:acetoacetate--CoA ligase n=1 Tax=Labrenzia sp. DG1229 TaxID=681847 RepID=UPI00049025C2|nr:acetoacetate--CoA ligase [Labrenzia sp. DG1229]